MGLTSEALVSTGPGAAEIREVPVRAGLDGGGLGDVLAAGVCGTDISLFGPSALGDRIRPFVFGHENIVRLTDVDDLAAERWGVAVGDRVLVEEYVPCGHCRLCRSGRYGVCPQTDFLQPRFLRYGRMAASEPGPWGGFGSHLYLHPNTWLHHVPEVIPDHVAPLAVPLANALRWLTELAPVTPGDVVVVIGPGAIGLCAAVMARNAGAGRVVVVGTASDVGRLEVAKRLGADGVVAEVGAPAADAVQAHIGGPVARVVVDATGGAPAALDLAGAAAGFGATVVLSGAGPATSSGLLAAAAEKELIIRGARGHHGRAIDSALGLIAGGEHPFTEMVSPPAPLAVAADTLRWLRTADPDRPIHISIVPKKEGL